MDPRMTTSPHVPGGTSFRHRIWLIILLLALSVPLPACTALNQVIPTGRSHNVSLQSGDLGEQGLGFITPSTVSGKEVDMQAVSLIFEGVLRDRRPQIRTLPLSETIGSVNRGGLAEDYKTMLKDYRLTGIFERDTLKKIGEITGVRYLAQVKLANFSQKHHGRFSAFGLRLIHTKVGNIRLFLSVWDSWDGSIAWEGIQELNYSYETFREKPVTFKQAVEESSKEMVKRLP